MLRPTTEMLSRSDGWAILLHSVANAWAMQLLTQNQPEYLHGRPCVWCISTPEQILPQLIAAESICPNNPWRGERLENSGNPGIESRWRNVWDSLRDFRPPLFELSRSESLSLRARLRTGLGLASIRWERSMQRPQAHMILRLRNFRVDFYWAAEPSPKDIIYCSQLRWRYYGTMPMALIGQMFLFSKFCIVKYSAQVIKPPSVFWPLCRQCKRSQECHHVCLADRPNMSFCLTSILSSK